MATVGTLAVTLQDWASRLDPKGGIAKIVEILNETNEIVEDMPIMEGNLPTGHKSTIRAGLPTSTWRLFNQGVAYSKDKTIQVVDTCGMLTSMSRVDEELAKLNGNTAEFHLSMDRAHIESMNQEMAQTLIYGNAGTDPEEFTGLDPRFNSSGGENAENILYNWTGYGTGSDNTSVWLIVWGENAAGYGIFPKGSKAGLEKQDLGIQLVNDGSSNPYTAYVRKYQWKFGLCIRDWRYVVRICNIDTSELTSDASAGADLVDLMAQAMELVPNLNAGKPVFYCNKKIKSFLRRQQKNTTNVNITLEQAFGKQVLRADGIPVKKVDQITNTESTIS